MTYNSPDHTGDQRIRGIQTAADDARRALQSVNQPTESIGKACEQLEAAVRLASAPFRLAFLGRANVGKSTLINALVGAPVAYVDVLNATAFPTEYKYGESSAAAITYKNGDVEALSVEALEARVRAGQGDAAVCDTIAHASVTWPAEALKRIELWDVPGVGGLQAHEEVALQFASKIGAAVWVFDAGLLGQMSIRAPLTELHRQGIRLVAAVNKAEDVPADDRPRVVEYVESSYPGVFEEICLVSATHAGGEWAPYLRRLEEAIQARIIDSSAADRKRRYDLEVAKAAGGIASAINDERRRVEAFLGFIRHVRRNLDIRLEGLLRELPRWVDEECNAAASNAESDALAILQGGSRDDVRLAFEGLADALNAAWPDVAERVIRRAANYWEDEWFKAVSLSFAAVPAADLPVPAQGLPPELRSVEEKAIRAGLAAGGKAAAVATAIAAALTIIHWPIVLVSLPVGLLEWWRKRGPWNSETHLGLLAAQLTKNVRDFRTSLAAALERETRKTIAARTAEAIDATVESFKSVEFPNSTLEAIQHAESSLSRSMRDLRNIRTGIMRSHGVPDPPDPDARPLVISPDTAGLNRWAGFLSDRHLTLDVVLPTCWISLASLLRGVAPGTAIRILSSCSEPERSTAADHFARELKDWPGPCAIRIVTDAAGNKVNRFGQTWIVTDSEALLCADQLDQIGKRECRWEAHPDGLRAAQDVVGRFWRGDGSFMHDFRTWVIR